MVAAACTGDPANNGSDAITTEQPNKARASRDRHKAHMYSTHSAQSGAQRRSINDGLRTASQRIVETRPYRTIVSAGSKPTGTRCFTVAHMGDSWNAMR